MQRQKLLLIPLLVAALLFLPLLTPLGPVDIGPITIDGDASDWAGAIVATFPRTSGVNPNVDVLRFGTTDNGNALAFLIEVDGSALRGGDSPPTGDRFDVFVDTDRDASTGYRIDGLGADRLIELSGWQGAVNESALFEWNRNEDPYDWRGWFQTTPVTAAAAGRGLETQVDWLALGLEKGPVFATVQARGFDGSTDTAEYSLDPFGGALVVRQEPIPTATLTRPNETLLQLDIAAYGVEAGLEGLTVTLTGSARSTAVGSLQIIDGNGVVVDERLLQNGRAAFRFPERRYSAGSSERLLVVAQTQSASGETLGAILDGPSDVVAPDAAVTVLRLPSARDVGYVASEVLVPRIDGGFAEWISFVSDPIGDVQGGRDGDIDLGAFAAETSGSATFFFAEVEGRLMAGTWVPEKNSLAPPPRTPIIADTDRDGVPDSVDPLPLDFNNDGTPDAQSGGDADGDGILDHGRGGPDLWLNTTIPSSFPSPYAGRDVRTYIGPVERPFRSRDDVLRVFVDVDNSTSSGYQLGGLGADRLVEVSGASGNVRSSGLFSFSGSYPGQWSWVRISDVSSALSFDYVEFAASETLLNGSRVYVEIGEALGARDAIGATSGASLAGSQPAAAAVSPQSASSFDVAPSPLSAAVRGSPAPPHVLDIGGNAKYYLRDTNHATETACTTSKVADAGPNVAPVNTITLSTTQSACWYLDATTGTTIPAGDWESLLDVGTSTALSVATGSFSTGTTAGTTVTVTTGFQPTVYFLWWSGSEDTTDTASATNHKRGFGVGISTTDRRAVCSFSDHAELAADTSSGHRSDAVLCSLTSGGSLDALVDHDATLSDGFRVIIDDSSSKNLRVHYLAIGGGDLTNVVSGMFTEAAAAFPTVGSSATSSRTTNAIDDSVTLPASVASGDLVLVFHHSDGSLTRTFPSPWVEIKDATSQGGTSNIGIAYLIASGGETSVTVTKSGSETFSAITIRITAASWHGTTAPEVTAGVTGISANPNPGTITASWGSADNLFIAVHNMENADGGRTTTAFPTSYTGNQIQAPNNIGQGGAIATRELAAATDDPGTFTLSLADEAWWAGTVVVRPAATINQDVTDVGFQPDAVVLFSAMIGADPPGIQSDSSIMIGLAAGAGNPNDVVWAGGSNNAADPTQTVAYSRAGESIALLDAGVTATDGRAEVDAWLSNGFSLNWNERAGSRRIHYVALKGGQHAVGDVLTRTDTTSFSETGLPFTPSAGLFLSHSNAQSTADTVQDYDEWSLGSVTAATTRRAQCANDADNSATSDVGLGVHHNALYCNLNNAGAFEGLMDVVSVNADGWTLVMDDADPTASFVGYWAIAPRSVEYDVQIQIWNKDTDSVRSTLVSCLDQTATGDDVRCFALGIAQQTIASNEVVRIRIAHSSASGTVTIDYDDADTTGDSRVTIPIPEFDILAVPFVSLVIVSFLVERKRRSAGRSGPRSQSPPNAAILGGRKEAP